jgi:hypothetical protein
MLQLRMVLLLLLLLVLLHLLDTLSALTQQQQTNQPRTSLAKVSWQPAQGTYPSHQQRGLFRRRQLSQVSSTTSLYCQVLLPPLPLVSQALSNLLSLKLPSSSNNLQQMMHVQRWC